MILVVGFLLLQSLPAFDQIGVGRFATDSSWHPGSGSFGIAPMLVASLSITLGAVFIAAPVGVGSALLCRYFAPRSISATYRRLLELLAGIPSVVYGLWGLVVLVPLIGHNLLGGVLVLALMIVPTVAIIADSALGAVPPSYAEGCAALGLTRWATIRGVLLPAARGGLVSAITLAAARAIGETMVVLMVCGNVVQIPRSLLDPVRTLTANIALEMSYAAGVHWSALFVSGLVLLGLVFLLMALADLVGGGDSRDG